MTILVAAALAMASPCTVSGTAAEGDVVRARTACETARARFADLFGTPAPALEIVLWDRAGYRVSDVGEGARVYWPSSAALQRSPATGRAADPALQWREVLPHEAMHALLAAEFFEPGDHREAAYGTPLPDWFEEAVAIWAESAAHRRQRVAQARNLPAELRALSTILTGEHPAARNKRLLAARDGAALPDDDLALWAFYPQAIAVLTFVHDAGGAAAVRALAERLLLRHPDSDVLAGLPGLPAAPDELEMVWARWLPRSAESPSLHSFPPSIDQRVPRQSAAAHVVLE